jgi:hypothetical protein
VCQRDSRCPSTNQPTSRCCTTLGSTAPTLRPSTSRAVAGTTRRPRGGRTVGDSGGCVPDNGVSAGAASAGRRPAGDHPREHRGCGSHRVGPAAHRRAGRRRLRRNRGRGANTLSLAARIHPRSPVEAVDCRGETRLRSGGSWYSAGPSGGGRCALTTGSHPVRDGGDWLPLPNGRPLATVSVGVKRRPDRRRRVGRRGDRRL